MSRRNGSVFHKVARQSLKKNRTGTLVTIIGVALSAALFTAIAVFGTSIISFMADSEIAKGGQLAYCFLRCFAVRDRGVGGRAGGGRECVL